MIDFQDGPAQGQGGKLLIRRAPLHLRVVRSASGEWDALDQLDDTPRPDEQVFAYRLVEAGSAVHLSMRDKRGRRTGGWFVAATYAHVVEQPAEDVMRDTAKWRDWCLARQREQNSEGLRAVQGKWPGEETDREIEEGLKHA